VTYRRQTDYTVLSFDYTTGTPYDVNTTPADDATDVNRAGWNFSSISCFCYSVSVVSEDAS